MTKVITGAAMTILMFMSPLAAIQAQTEASVEAEVSAQQSSDANRGTQADEESDMDAQDMDADGDGVPTTSGEAQGNAGQNDRATVQSNVRVEQGTGAAAAAQKEIDKASPKLYQAIEISGSVCAETGDCDDEEGDVFPGSEGAAKLQVRVSGDEVRGMSAEAKADVQARLETLSEINDANDFGLRVAGAALEQEALTEVRSSDEATEVEYTTTVNIFGFIPARVQATAQARANGDAEVNYPWYSFFATGDANRDAMAALAADIRADHEVLISVEEEGAPVNRRQEDGEDAS